MFQLRYLFLPIIALLFGGCVSEQHKMQSAQVEIVANELAAKTKHDRHSWSAHRWSREYYDKIRVAIAPAQFRSYWRVYDRVPTDYFFADGTPVFKVEYRKLTDKEHRDRLDYVLWMNGLDREARAAFIKIITQFEITGGDWYQAEFYRNLYIAMED